MNSVTEAAKTGNRRKTLEALRDKLAATIDECTYGRDVAALSRRLLEVCAELDTLPDESNSPLAEARRKYA